VQCRIIRVLEEPQIRLVDVDQKRGQNVIARPGRCDDRKAVPVPGFRNPAASPAWRSPFLTPLLVDIDKPGSAAPQGRGLSRHCTDGDFSRTLEYVLEEGTRWNWFDDGTITSCAWIAAISGICLSCAASPLRASGRSARTEKIEISPLDAFLSFVTGIGIFHDLSHSAIPGILSAGSARGRLESRSLDGCRVADRRPIYIFLARSSTSAG